MTLAIPEWTVAAAADFMAVEWPPYNAAVGVEWTATDVVLVATQGVPIGVAYGVVVGGLGELRRLLVKEGGHARTGVGARLLEAFEERCVSLGCHKLRLETADYQARPFYERHGFTLGATLANDRFGHDWFVMEKRLRLDA